jgi:uncharacterized membrane protein HdeD (DUF308 family)
VDRADAGVLGILLVANPVAGLVALVWIIGAYALISGAQMVIA